MIVEDCVSTKEAAAVLCVDKSRVLVLCKQGRFRGARKVGRDWLIPREAVDTFERLPRGGRISASKQKQKDTELLSDFIKASKNIESAGQKS